MIVEITLSEQDIKDAIRSYLESREMNCDKAKISFHTGAMLNPQPVVITMFAKVTSS